MRSGGGGPRGPDFNSVADEFVPGVTFRRWESHIQVPCVFNGTGALRFLVVTWQQDILYIGSLGEWSIP